MAIDYILHTKDWRSLKLILLQATKPENEISQAWRDAIPQEVKRKIYDFSQDNAYKACGIDMLMQRLERLNLGHNDVERLRDMADPTWAMVG